MSPALVKVGQQAAAALRGGPRWAWAPNLLLWIALVAGSALGAIAYRRIDLPAIWFAVATAFVLANVLSATLGRARA